MYWAYIYRHSRFQDNASEQYWVMYRLYNILISWLFISGHHGTKLFSNKEFDLNITCPSLFDFCFKHWIIDTLKNIWSTLIVSGYYVRALIIECSLQFWNSSLLYVSSIEANAKMLHWWSHTLKWSHIMIETTFSHLTISLLIRLRQITFWNCQLFGVPP